MNNHNHIQIIFGPPFDDNDQSKDKSFDIKSKKNKSSSTKKFKTGYDRPTIREKCQFSLVGYWKLSTTKSSANVRINCEGKTGLNYCRFSQVNFR